MKIPPAIWFLFLTGMAAAQDFTRYYQLDADLQVANHLLKDPSGGFWLGGYKSSNGENPKAWIYHLNENGDVLKKQSFPGNDAQVWAGMAFTGNRLAAVIGLQQFTGETRYYLAMMGDSLESWRYIPGLDNAALHDLRPGTENRVLISGFRGSPGIAGNDFFLARINTDSARAEWIFYEEFGPNDIISTSRELPDRSVLFCGTVAEQGNYNPCMGKLDSAGNLSWLTVMTTIWNDGAQKFELADNGDIWLVGESSTSAGPEFDTELFRISADGQVLWQQWIGSPGQDAAFHIQKKTTQPGFWVAGYSNAAEFGIGPVSPFLMSLDMEGSSLGEAFWPMSSPSLVYDMVVEGDSLFYFCGTSSNAAFFMRRKNPSLSPVFVVGSKENVRKQNPQNWLEDFRIALKNGEIAEAFLMDGLGRKIRQIGIGSMPILLPEITGAARIGWKRSDGRLGYSPAFTVLSE